MISILLIQPTYRCNKRMIISLIFAMPVIEPLTARSRARPVKPARNGASVHPPYSSLLDRQPLPTICAICPVQECVRHLPAIIPTTCVHQQQGTPILQAEVSREADKRPKGIENRGELADGGKVGVEMRWIGVCSVRGEFRMISKNYSVQLRPERRPAFRRAPVTRLCCW